MSEGTFQHDTYGPGLIHYRCGGEVRDDWEKTYPYGTGIVPALRCTKCGEEILGDAQLVSQQ